MYRQRFVLWYWYLIIYCGSNIATDMAAAHPEAKTAIFDRAL